MGLLLRKLSGIEWRRMAVIRTTFACLSLFLLGFVSRFGRVVGPVPAHFPRPEFNEGKLQLNPYRVELGRHLFYDPILSKDNSISCASCHSPFHAFAHVDHDLSHGIQDSILDRNAPALFNLAWSRFFMWDGAVHRLDVQPLAPITSAREMGSDLKTVLLRLNQSPYKNWIKRKGLGDSFSTDLLLAALRDFQLTLVSATSRYDSMAMGSVVFSEQENRGYVQFKKHCSNCHREPLFNQKGFENNGLLAGKRQNHTFDLGRMLVTGNSEDSLKFKVPSLRNLRYTYPYMHDGRFKNLQGVLKHYQGVFGFSNDEKQDIVAFLLTLNDPHFVQDKRHHFPHGKILQ